MPELSTAPPRAKFLSLDELAARWGYQAKTLRNWLAGTGGNDFQKAFRKLPTRIGGRVRFSIARVEKFEASRDVGKLSSSES